MSGRILSLRAANQLPLHFSLPCSRSARPPPLPNRQCEVSLDSSRSPLSPFIAPVLSFDSLLQHAGATAADPKGQDVTSGAGSRGTNGGPKFESKPEAGGNQGSPAPGRLASVVIGTASPLLPKELLGKGREESDHDEISSRSAQPQPINGSSRQHPTLAGGDGVDEHERQIVTDTKEEAANDKDLSSAAPQVADNKRMLPGHRAPTK